MLEAGPSIGGVWNHERLYPGLKSNNMLGTYEYSDFPMDTATFGVKAGEHIPGTVLHKYLTAYAKEFGVYARTQLNTRVESAEENLQTGNWTLKTRNNLTGEEASLHAKKLIVATGLTSEPHVPTFPEKTISVHQSSTLKTSVSERTRLLQLTMSLFWVVERACGMLRMPMPALEFQLT